MKISKFGNFFINDVILKKKIFKKNFFRQFRPPENNLNFLVV
jgi:hypothetical protein